MAIFREIERRLENLVEGFFNHRFSSALQPIELARKLSAEMDRKRQVSVAHTYAPNVFMIHLSPTDFDELEGFHQALSGELTAYVKAHAEEKGYRFSGAVLISMAPEPDIRLGECNIHSHIEEISAPTADGSTQIISARELSEALAPGAQAYLIDRAAGIEYRLRRRTITIGRKSDNDIVVEDPAASRHHARLEAEGDDFFLVDLDSTNGTSLNGEAVGRVRLVDGNIFSIGQVELTFRQDTGD